MDQNICVVGEHHFFSIFEYSCHDGHILELGGSPDGLHAGSAIIGCDNLERFDGGGQNWHSVDLADLLGLVKPASVIHGGKSIISSLQACHISTDCCSFLLRIKMFFHHYLTKDRGKYKASEENVKNVRRERGKESHN